MAFFFIFPFSDYYTTTASDSLQINTSRKVYIYIIVALLYMYHPKLHSEFVQVRERCFCVIVCCITSSFISVCVCVSDEVNFTSVVSVQEYIPVAFPDGLELSMLQAEAYTVISVLPISGVRPGTGFRSKAILLGA